MTPTAKRVAEALEALKRKGSRKHRDQLGPRFGILAPTALGVPMAEIQRIGKRLGQDHELAAALWDTGVYEARLLASFVDDPAHVTSAQMDRWARDFDNWGVVDTVCFKLFDRTPLAWNKVAPWCRSKHEFVKRAGFVLIACLSLHDKEAPDRVLAKFIPLIRKGAEDERNFVKKGVSWALRALGRRSPSLRTPCLALARELATSEQPAPRWVSKDALRELANGS